MYCERYGPGLLSEPLNAITNLAFLIAAWAVWCLAKRDNSPNIEVNILVAMISAIAIGSLLYHTLATPWSWVLDVVPILLFQATYLWLYLRRIVRLRATAGHAISFLFLLTVLLIWAATDAFFGSLPYLPALLLLIALGIYHYRHCNNDRKTLFIAAVVFSLALFFRTIDLPVCESFSTGTHFVWHILIAVTVYLCTRAFVSNRQQRQPVRRQPDPIKPEKSG